MFVVLINGAENVNAFSLVVNNVVDVAFKFEIAVVWPFINNIDALEKLFKFVNIDVLVEFELLIDVFTLLIDVFMLLIDVLMPLMDEVLLFIDVVLPETVVDKLFKFAFVA